MTSPARFGLGLAALGRPGYMNLGHGEDLAGDYDAAAMERRCHAVLDAAHAAGIRWFDTARSYGRGEEFLASWLAARGVPPGAVTVSSKWGYTYTAAWQVVAKHHEIKDHSLAALERQLAESRAVLGPYLSLYQVHSATLESGILDDERALARLGALRDEGLPVGLSLSGPRQAETLERALRIRVDGRPLWSAVQATWNLVERGAPEPLRREAARLGVGPDAVALAAALARPFADVVLSGAATVTQLAENLRAVDVDGAAAASELGSLAEPAERYWAERAKLPWN